MTLPDGPAVPLADLVLTPISRMSANDTTNLTLSSATPAPDHAATSHLSMVNNSIVLVKLLLIMCCHISQCCVDFYHITVYHSICLDCLPPYATYSLQTLNIYILDYVELEK